MGELFICDVLINSLSLSILQVIVNVNKCFVNIHFHLLFVIRGGGGGRLH